MKRNFLTFFIMLLIFSFSVAAYSKGSCADCDNPICQENPLRCSRKEAKTPSSNPALLGIWRLTEARRFMVEEENEDLENVRDLKDMGPFLPVELNKQGHTITYNFYNENTLLITECELALDKKGNKIITLDDDEPVPDTDYFHYKLKNNLLMFYYDGEEEDEDNWGAIKYKLVDGKLHLTEPELEESIMILTKVKPE